MKITKEQQKEIADIRQFIHDNDIHSNKRQMTDEKILEHINNGFDLQFLKDMIYVRDSKNVIFEETLEWPTEQSSKEEKASLKNLEDALNRLIKEKEVK